MSNFLADNLIASLAVAVSLVALCLNYRTSRRQKLADNPKLFFGRGQGQVTIILTNQGASSAFDVSVETQKGSFIQWSNQSNKALEKSDGAGGIIRGPLCSKNCYGETRTINVNESKRLIIAEDMPKDEVIVVRYKNYMKKKIKQQKSLSQIYWE